MAVGMKKNCVWCWTQIFALLFCVSLLPEFPIMLISQFGKPVTDGRFTLESTYASISSQSGQANPLFKVVWRWSGPERTRILLWKTAQQALVTNDFRAKKGMSLSNACHVCDVASENAVHCFRDCPHAIQMSSRLLNVNIGLKLASKKGFSDLIVESDSLVAIKLLTGSCSTNHSSNQLVCNIGQLADQRSLVWHHVFWGVNQVADSLAKSVTFMVMMSTGLTCMPLQALSYDVGVMSYDVVADPSELIH
ncbi:hypothetical protein JHK85_032895 [Glycine max]|nr:hypothetical protein JHK85_032895 [Glycine max]